MILADKIIRARKKNGWSQEELAEKMKVSRQAVSKWESAQTVPDLEKILQLSALFGVTTDYLLKDELEEEDLTEDASGNTVKKVTVDEANEYLAWRKIAARRIAFATLLCILSPITLILLGGASEIPSFGISETVMGVIGLTVLFAFVLTAVPIYIYCGFQNEPYEFLDKNLPFELEYGVRALLTERKKQWRDTYIRANVIACCICIFAPIPLILSGFTGNEFLSVLMLAVTMITAGIGVFIFINVGVQQASIEKLLREGEYEEKQKEKNALKESVGFVYWGILTAVFFVWSFLSNDWHLSWLVFAVGGILFPAVMCLCDILTNRKK